MPLYLSILKDDKITKQKAFQALENHEVNSKLVAQVVRCESLNLRSGNAHTKTRGEVSGGGKKPWKQKGTGRARHGSTRSPLWVGGGVVFGPRNQRNWHRKINKSARKSALKSIIKDRAVNEMVFQLDPGNFLKTKNALESLTPVLDKTKSRLSKIVMLYSTKEKPSTLGYSNLELAKMNIGQIKLINLVKADVLLLTPEATSILESKIN